MAGAPIARTSGGSLRGATSRYAGEIQAAFQGSDTSSVLKSTLSGLWIGVGISTSKLRFGTIIPAL